MILCQLEHYMFLVWEETTYQHENRFQHIHILSVEWTPANSILLFILPSPQGLPSLSPLSTKFLWAGTGFHSYPTCSHGLFPSKRCNDRQFTLVPWNKTVLCKNFSSVAAFATIWQQDFKRLRVLLSYNTMLRLYLVGLIKICSSVVVFYRYWAAF